MGCCKRFNNAYIQGHISDFKWDNCNKITLENFRSLVKEG